MKRDGVIPSFQLFMLPPHNPLTNVMFDKSISTHRLFIPLAERAPASCIESFHRHSFFVYFLELRVSKRRTLLPLNQVVSLGTRHSFFSFQAQFPRTLTSFASRFSIPTGSRPLSVRHPTSPVHVTSSSVGHLALSRLNLVHAKPPMGCPVCLPEQAPAEGGTRGFGAGPEPVRGSREGSSLLPAAREAVFGQHRSAVESAAALRSCESTLLYTTHECETCCAEGSSQHS